ncbi:hypothetical protein K457DRAFT_898477, partial [Linnemannia elongata AG-77]
TEVSLQGSPIPHPAYPDPLCCQHTHLRTCIKATTSSFHVTLSLSFFLLYNSRPNLPIASLFTVPPLFLPHSYTHSTFNHEVRNPRRRLCRPRRLHRLGTSRPLGLHPVPPRISQATPRLRQCRGDRRFGLARLCCLPLLVPQWLLDRLLRHC